MSDEAFVSRLAHGKIELLILQPTPFCNIDCTYCYLPGRQDRSRMSEAVLAAACDRLGEAGLVGATLSIVWHAGEPLVMPVAWYERAFDLVAERLPQTAVTHSFQTNGMLIDAAWCRLFQRPDVRVGVSIDGPRTLHDRHRVTRAGAGTHARAMQGIRRLQAVGIDFHVISVLTRNALFFPDELYAFYVDGGIRDVCFNIEEIEGPYQASSLKDPRCLELCRRFYKRFLDLVSESDDIRSVRELDYAFSSILDPQRARRSDNQQAEPFGIVTVGCNGDVSTFSPELLGNRHPRFPDFVFGNVLKDSFQEMLATEKLGAIAREIRAGVERCRRTCSYFELCGGGMPVNKLYETGRFDSDETLFCRYTVQLLTDLALDALEAGQSRRGQSAPTTAGAVPT